MIITTVSFPEGQAQLIKLDAGKRWFFRPKSKSGRLGKPTRSLPRFVMKALDIRDSNVE